MVAFFPTTFFHLRGLNTIQHIIIIACFTQSLVQYNKSKTGNKKTKNMNLAKEEEVGLYALGKPPVVNQNLV